MMAHTENIQPAPAPGLPRTVALVGRYAHQHLRSAMLGAADCDVVFVESTTHAYSKIKRVHPDLVIVCLSSDDADGCRLLSMLALDDDTSRIPVLTHLTSPADGVGAEEDDQIADRFICVGPTSLN